MLHIAVIYKIFKNDDSSELEKKKKIHEEYVKNLLGLFTKDKHYQLTLVGSRSFSLDYHEYETWGTKAKRFPDIFMTDFRRSDAESEHSQFVTKKEEMLKFSNRVICYKLSHISAGIDYLGNLSTFNEHRYKEDKQYISKYIKECGSNSVEGIVKNIEDLIAYTNSEKIRTKDLFYDFIFKKYSVNYRKLVKIMKKYTEKKVCRFGTIEEIKELLMDMIKKNEPDLCNYKYCLPDNIKNEDSEITKLISMFDSINN